MKYYKQVPNPVNILSFSRRCGSVIPLSPLLSIFCIKGDILTLLFNTCECYLE